MTHLILKFRTTILILLPFLAFGVAENGFAQEVGFVGAGSSESELTEKEQAALGVGEQEYDITFIALSDIDSDGVSALEGFDVVWWHYTGIGEDGALPEEAVSETALEAFSNYVSDGGGLFLSSLASQLATEMGLNESPPDQVFEGGTNEDTGNWGHYILDEEHPIFEDVPNPFYTVSEGIDLYDVNFSFWNGATPFDGTRLATIELSEEEPHTTIGEWTQEEGIVLFASGVAHQYVWEGNNVYEQDLHRFTHNVIAYLDANATSNERTSEIPDEIRLHQNHPNPFNPTTNIAFDLNVNTEVTLTVHDMLGREVATLINGERYNTGQHQVTFDASGLSSGIYIYRIQTNEVSKTQKMNLIK